VGKRILMAREMSAADYVDLCTMREAYMREIATLAVPFDAILMPTTPCVAPPIAEVDGSDEAFFRWTFRIVRNVGLVNFLDGCAVSLPCHEPGSAPVGLSVFAPALADRRLLMVAAAVERALEPRTRRFAERG
jgi:aspartyl-tRNA(Asn)/glutamyl-tRNA(Gln) amidotransferase subunit A